MKDSMHNMTCTSLMVLFAEEYNDNLGVKKITEMTTTGSMKELLDDVKSL